MRRLPIYFLIDVSESMIGEPIQNVEEGMASIIKALKSDPYAIETVWISVLVFAGQAKTIIPLQEIAEFYPPRFPIGGGTSLSKGLGHLMYELRNNIVKTTHERKGDWKPIVFLLTDGVPTDDTRAAIQEWKQNWQQSANLVAISFGHETDLSLLTELTPHVLMFDPEDTAQYTAFFKWVTDSIKTSSVSVDNNASGFELAKLDEKVITKIDLTKKNIPQEYVDPNYVVLAAKCQQTKRPYLMKYKKVLKDSPFSDLGLQTLAYRLKGAFQVDNTYYELLDSSVANQHKINSEELIGAPTCPSCGNQYGLAICSCGGIHCIGDEDYSTCPWCQTQARYGTGGGGFDINRTQG